MSYNGRECWLCGANGMRDPLDKHHIFGGVSLRKVSEKYGATVYLCHDKCHENGPRAAHRCRETRERLQAYGQRKVMLEQGWTVEEWRLVFGKNYLSEEELAEVAQILAGEAREERAGQVSGPYGERCAGGDAPYEAGASARPTEESGFKLMPVVALPF